MDHSSVRSCRLPEVSPALTDHNSDLRELLDNGRVTHAHGEVRRIKVLSEGWYNPKQTALGQEVDLTPYHMQGPHAILSIHHAGLTWTR